MLNWTDRKMFADENRTDSRLLKKVNYGNT